MILLCKGKRIDTGEWIVGSLWDYVGVPKILSACNIVGYDVDPDTVGIYSCKDDKSGEKLFTGDLVKCSFVSPSWHKSEGVCEVAFRDYAFGLLWVRPGSEGQIEMFHPFASLQNVELKKIGNVHDVAIEAHRFKKQMEEEKCRDADN